MFRLIPSEANDPQRLMRRQEPNKQNLYIDVTQGRMASDLLGLVNHVYQEAMEKK